MLRFLAAAGLQPNDTIGVEPVRRRRITAEKVAIAALMAGCLPEYMPVVVAIIKALCQPELGLHGSTASTGGSAPFIVVNGPIRLALGMNTTHNALANASRANATIGRSIRLFLLNVLGGVPGQLDRSTLGHPGKFTFCIAEDEEGTSWLPLVGRARHSRRNVRGDRDGGGIAAPDHERVDARPERNLRHLRRRDPQQHADLLDLGGELRDRDPQAASRHLRRRDGARPTSANTFSKSPG